MTIFRTMYLASLMIIVGSISTYAIASPWYDTASNAIEFNKTTCLIGTVRYGHYYIVGHRNTSLQYLYLHLNNPVNIFRSYFHPNTGYNMYLSTGHQYDFQIFVNSTKATSYMMQFVGKTVQIIGSIIPSTLPQYYSPLPLDMKIQKIKILEPSATYKSVCKARL